MNPLTVAQSQLFSLLNFAQVGLDGIAAASGKIMNIVANTA